MKPTVFLHGLLPSRHSTLVRHLATRFDLMAFKEYWSFAERRVEFAEDVAPLEHPWGTWPGFEAAFDEMMRFSRKELSEWLELPGFRPNEIVEHNLRNIACHAFFVREQFRAVLGRRAVRMLVLGADYSGGHRSLVIEARARGIPVLDVEHGFFAGLPRSCAYRSGYRPMFLFASDYVNTDAQADREVLEDWQAGSGITHPIAFLTEGTPNDVSVDRNLTREGARAALGLSVADPVVVIAGTWLEARAPSRILLGHLEVARFFESVFDEIGKIQQAKGIQVVIKLHPRFSLAPGGIAAMRRFLTRAADRRGVEIHAILTDRLSETLAAADVMVVSSTTSMVWESFLAEVPSIAWPGPYFLQYLDPAQLPASSELAREGFLTWVFAGDQFRAAVEDLLGDLAARRERMRQFRERTGQNPSSADEKSQRLCDWIETECLKRGEGADMQASPSGVGTGVAIASMAAPPIEVAIPTYNGMAYLKEAVHSVLSQTFPDFRLFVVDDDSSDGTDAWVRSLRDERVVYLRNPKRLGLIENWNRCLDLFESEFIYIMHDDDIMEPENLRRKFEFLENHPSVSFVHSSFHRISRDGTIIDADVQQSDLVDDALIPGEVFIRRGFLSLNPVCCPSVMMRRSFVRKAGRFDLSVYWSVDWHYWFRLAALGDVGYLGQALVRYRMYPEAESGAYYRSPAKAIAEYVACKRAVARDLGPTIPGLDRLLAIAEERHARDAALAAARSLAMGRSDEALACLRLAMQITPRAAVHVRKLGLEPMLYGKRPLSRIGPEAVAK